MPLARVFATVSKCTAMTGDSPRYDPSIFVCKDLDQAKRVILTLPTQAEVEWHWREETPRLARLIVEHLRIQAHHRVLDFGCGVGRLAKEIIALTGCTIVGVDISPTMRTMATNYVDVPEFSVAAPVDEFDTKSAAGAFDGAYAVLVLQHSEWPGEDVACIAHSLKLGGRFVLVNAPVRAVPTEIGWGDDGVDVFQIVNDILKFELRFEHPARAYTPAHIPIDTICAVFRRE